MRLVLTVDNGTKLPPLVPRSNSENCWSKANILIDNGPHVLDVKTFKEKTGIESIFHVTCLNLTPRDGIIAITLAKSTLNQKIQESALEVYHKPTHHTCYTFLY